MTINLHAMGLLVLTSLFFSFNLPDDWIKAGSEPQKYEMGAASNMTHDGHAVMTLRSIEKDIRGFGTLMQKMNAAQYAGKRIRMTGYLRSKDVKGRSGFWMRVDEANSKQPASIDDMSNRAIKGTVGWKKYEIVLDVPDNASNISFGALLLGEGQIWFDENLAFEIVGNDVAVTGLSNPLNATTAALKLVTQAGLDSTRSLIKGDKKLHAAYLSLNYDFHHVDSVEWIYSEVKVPRGEAPVHTYYSAIGGRLFYAGIQMNSKKERRVIFSVWDANSGYDNEKKVPDSIRAVLLTASKNVIYHRFGSEGSGVHTHYVYDWKEDSTYKFLVHVVPDLTGRSTTFACFVQIENDWKMIAKIKTPEYIGYPGYAYSFLENFGSGDDVHRRSASYQNTWVRTANGEWKEITQAILTLPFEGKDTQADKLRKVKDYGCGLSGSYGFMLSSGGGFTGTYIPLPASIKRDAKGIVPLTVMPE